jgi:hypothetical protein
MIRGESMTGLKHCLKFFLLAAILSGWSTPCAAQSSGGQVVMEEGGKIWRINSQGWKIKYYLVASSKNNIGLQVRDDRFYVLRKNYQVFVFDLDGKMIKVYFVNRNTKVWVR